MILGLAVLFDQALEVIDRRLEFAPVPRALATIEEVGRRRRARFMRKSDHTSSVVVFESSGFRIKVGKEATHRHERAEGIVIQDRYRQRDQERVLDPDDRGHRDENDGERQQNPEYNSAYVFHIVHRAISAFRSCEGCTSCLAVVFFSLPLTWFSLENRRCRPNGGTQPAPQT